MRRHAHTRIGHEAEHSMLVAVLSPFLVWSNMLERIRVLVSTP